MGGPYDPYGRQSWVGLLLFGIFAIVVGVIALSFSAANSSSDPLDPFSQINNEAARNFGIFGAGFIIVGIVMIVLSFVVKGRAEVRQQEEIRSADEARQREVEEIAQAVKSTIKIRCRYCGTLNDENSSKCESCGASL